MGQVAGERAAAPGAASASGVAGPAGPAPPRRWRVWAVLVALSLVVAASVVGLTAGVGDRPPAARKPTLPGAHRATSAGALTGATGLARVVPAGNTGSTVRAGASVPEVNGIADGLGRLWLTGGNAVRSHVLFAVNPATGRIEAQVALPSRLIINPNDVAIGSGDVWVAVGASVYRVQPASTPAGAMTARAFAALPPGSLIGDVVASTGSVWVTDTSRGRVYRFAAATGRLDAVIPVGAAPGAMAAGDGGVWVANENAHTVSRISVTRNRIDSVLAVPGVPGHLAASAHGLWVTDGAAGGVTALGGGRAVTVPVGGEPTGVAVAGDTVWVASTGSGMLSRIDARRHVVVARVRVGTRPYAVAADRRGAWVAVLGRPVMMHMLLRLAAAATGKLAWLARLCGEGWTAGAR